MRVSSGIQYLTPSLYLRVGQSVQYITVDDWAKRYYTFESGDESVMTINDSGVVTGVAAGETWINGTRLSYHDFYAFASDDALPVINLQTTGDATFAEDYSVSITDPDMTPDFRVYNAYLKFAVTFLDAQGMPLYSQSANGRYTGNTFSVVRSEWYAYASAKGTVDSLRITMMYDDSSPTFRIVKDSVNVSVGAYDNALDGDLYDLSGNIDSGLRIQYCVYNLMSGSAQVQVKLGESVLGERTLTADKTDAEYSVGSFNIPVTPAMYGAQTYDLYINGVKVCSKEFTITPPASASFSLYPSSLSLTVGGTGTATLGGEYSSFEVMSGGTDESVATTTGQTDDSITITAYKTGTTRIRVQADTGEIAVLTVNVAAAPLPPTTTPISVKPSSLLLTVGQSGTVTIGGEYSSFEVMSGGTDESVATVTAQTESSITVTAYKPGTTRIRLESDQGDIAVLSVKVVAAAKPASVIPTVTVTADAPFAPLGETVTFTVFFSKEAKISPDFNVYITVDGNERLKNDSWNWINFGPEQTYYTLGISGDDYGSYLAQGHTVTALRVELIEADEYAIGTPGEASVTFAPATKPFYMLSKPDGQYRPGETIPITVTCLNPELLTEDTELSFKDNLNNDYGSAILPAHGTSVVIDAEIPSSFCPEYYFVSYLYADEVQQNVYFSGSIRHGFTSYDYDIPYPYGNGYISVGQSEQYFRLEAWAKAYWQIESGDESVLSIDADGVITGISAGQTDITIRYPYGEEFCSQRFIVLDPNDGMPVLNLEAAGDAVFGEELSVRVAPSEGATGSENITIELQYYFLNAEGEIILLTKGIKYGGRREFTTTLDRLSAGDQLIELGIDTYVYSAFSALGERIDSIRVVMRYDGDGNDPGYRIGTDTITVKMGAYSTERSFGIDDLGHLYNTDYEGNWGLAIRIFAYHLASGSAEAEIRLGDLSLCVATLTSEKPYHWINIPAIPAMYGEQTYDLYIDGVYICSESFAFIQPGEFSAEPSYLTLTEGQTGIIRIIGDYSSFATSSGDESVAKVIAQTEDSVTVAALKPGSTEILFSADVGVGSYTSITVKVVPQAPSSIIPMLTIAAD